jgi:sugar-specific transcriptional regulator TrmB
MAALKNALRDFGLSDSESETYLAVLRLGSATPSEIVRKTSIHRINLYDILNRLQEKGLVSHIVIGKRKHYEAADPKRLLEIESERKVAIEAIIPELSAQRALAKAPQEATIFKDKPGIKNVLREMAFSKEPLHLFASGWGFRDYFPDYFDVWHRRLKENKVMVKTLMSGKFRQTKFHEVYKIRYLPSEFVFPSTTVVFGDKVFMVMWSEQPLAILVRSREISASYKKFFDLLWKASEK